MDEEIPITQAPVWESGQPAFPNPKMIILLQMFIQMSPQGQDCLASRSTELFFI
jgi:hypothetical protein